MSVSAAPDERWLIFDLLGQIYSLPIAGGQARCLTCDSARSLNYQPRISPDGRLIAFVSDRSGQDNLWVMNADGSAPRIIVEDKDSRIREPSWSPDSRTIYASRHFQRRHDLQAQIWSFDIATGAATKIAADRLIYYRAPYKAANGTLYFHTSIPTRNNIGALEGIFIQGIDAQGRRTFLRNHPELPADLNQSEYVQATLRAEQMAERPTRIPELGTAEFAPTPSPDGRFVAFGRQLQGETVTINGRIFGPRTALFVRDLQTGEERKLLDRATTDLMRFNRSYVDQAIPGFSWSRDGRHIYLSRDGKIHRLDVATGTLTEIPFTASISRPFTRPFKPSNTIDTNLKAKFVQWPTLSPDGSRLAYIAFGKLWIEDKRGARLALPASADLQHTPSWSADGRYIYYTTAGQGGTGHVWRLDYKSGTKEQITRTPGQYLYPVEIQGRQIAVYMSPGGRQGAYSAWDLVILGTKSRKDQNFGPALLGARPVQMANGALAFARPAKFDVELVTVRPDNNRTETIAVFPDAFRIPTSVVPTLSPDGRSIAVQFEQHLYRIPVAANGVANSINIAQLVSDKAVRNLSPDGGIYPSWRTGGQLEFANGPQHVVTRLNERSTERTVKATVPMAKNPETLLFRNARIITVDRQGIIERGDLGVRGGRILCVGTCPAIKPDRTIDLSGKTIMPGIVEIHNHDEIRTTQLLAPDDSRMATALSYGVTTIHDPSPFPSSEAVLPVGEAIAAGYMPGPRVFTSGEPAYGDNVEIGSIQSVEDAIAALKRRKAWGAISAKLYRLNARFKQQWLIEAARRLGLVITSEGGTLADTLGMVIDGQTGWEHPIAQLPIYSDVAHFVGATGANYSPTVSIAGHYKGAQHYFRDRAAGKPSDLSEFSFPIVADGLARMLDYGATGTIGGHGEQIGQGAHWEIWAYATGVGPLRAIKMATIYGAQFLGLERDLGSIAPGKVADLIVLNSDPLEKIENSADIALVVKNGELFDPQQLRPK